jgi:hypothetical protein
MVLVLAKAIGLQWETAMALLFLGAKEYRIGERDRAEMRRKFRRLDPEHLAAFYEINRALLILQFGTVRKTTRFKSPRVARSELKSR